MSKKKKGLPAEIDGEKKIKKETVWKLLTLILVTAVIFAVYRIAMKYPIFLFLMPTYYIALTALIAVYVIYNRGFARKNVTLEMLPDDWSYEEKTEFIEDGKRRLKKTNWMLMLIMAIAFTLGFELLELYTVPWLENLVS